MGTFKEAWSDTVAAGLVLRAGQQQGSRLRRDTAVDLVLSRGPKPIAVRDWTGTGFDQAAAALRKAGLQVAVTAQHSDEVPLGRVLTQEPASGSLAKGETVSLTRSLGPVLVTVPNVRAMGVRAAEAAMRQAGFTTRIKPASNYIGVGFVVSSSPGAAKQAPKGSTVTLYVV